MEHSHSITIHKDAGGLARIYVLTYENAKQVGDMKELAVEHPAYAAILSALKGEYQPSPRLHREFDAGALALHLVDNALSCIDSEDANRDADATTLKIQIEHYLASLSMPETEEKTAIDSEAAIATEDLTDTTPLSAAE